MGDESDGLLRSVRTFFDPYRGGSPGEELAEIAGVIQFLDRRRFPLGEALAVLQVLEPPDGSLYIDREASGIMLRLMTDGGERLIRIISYR